jgi:predicted ArsR family transcriptional regulator
MPPESGQSKPAEAPISGPAMAALCGLDDPVRRALYEYVCACAEPVTRERAGDATGAGRALAAYHLDKLVSLGLLTASYARRDGRSGPGAGRPAKVYSRSGQEFAVTVPPREYELAASLLATAVKSDQCGGALAALRTAARQLGASLGSPSGGSETADTGADTLAVALHGHGFEPFRDRNGSVVLRNCPFRQLAAAHPEIVCGMSLALIDGIVAGLGATGLRPSLEPGPDRCCVVIHDAGTSADPLSTGAT